MPTPWFRRSFLYMTALLGGLLFILSGCHLHHVGGYGYYGGGHHHGGGYYRDKHRGHDGRGHRRGGWRGRY